MAEERPYSEILRERILGGQTPAMPVTTAPVAQGEEVDLGSMEPDEQRKKGAVFLGLQSDAFRKLPPGEVEPSLKKRFYEANKMILRGANKARVMGVDDVDIQKVLEPAFQGITETKAFQNTMAVLDKLLIPQRAVFNSLYRLQSGDSSPEEFAEGLKGALTGREGKTTRDLTDKALDEMTEAGFMTPFVRDAIKTNPSYKAIAFGGDILVDPLNALGIGAATKLGKLSKIKTAAKGVEGGIKLGSEAADAIRTYYGAEKITKELIDRVPKLGKTAAEQARLGQRALITWMGRPVLKGEGIIKATGALRDAAGRTKAVKKIRELFSNRTGNQVVDDILFDTLTLMEAGKGEALEKGVEIAKRLKGVDIEQINLISKVLDEGLDYDVIQKGEKAAEGKIGLLPETAKVTEDIRKDFTYLKQAEMSKGILRSELENYFPRIATKEGKASLEEAGKLDNFELIPRAKLTTKTGFEKERKTAKFTLDDYNKKMLDEEGVEEFFTKDPAVASAIRHMRGVRAMATVDMLDQLTNKFALKAGEKGRKVTGVSRLDGFLFEPETADAIQRAVNVLNSSDKLADYAKLYDSVQNWWKGWTLGIRPSYHVRNAIGNVWQAFLGGVENPKRYFEAHRIQKGMDGVITTQTGQKVTYDQLRKVMKRYGVEGTGLYGGDIPDVLKKAVHEGTFDSAREGLKTIFTTLPEGKNLPARVGKKAMELLPLGPRDNQLMKMGFAVGKGIENNARAALFLDQVMRGVPYRDAAKHVAKYLFDYNDISQFEKSVVRRALPFYTWARKNIPLQIESIATQPQKFAPVPKGVHAIEDTPRQEQYPALPRFIRENVPIRIRTLPNGNHEYFLLGGWLPAADVEKLFHPLDATMTMLGPVPSTARYLTEEAALAFTSPKASRQFAAEQAAPAQFLGMKTTRGKRELGKTIPVLSEIDRLAFPPEGDEATATNKLLRALTGVKTFETSPARDTTFDRMQRAERLQQLVRKAEREKRKKK